MTTLTDVGRKNIELHNQNVTLTAKLRTVTAERDAANVEIERLRTAIKTYVNRERVAATTWPTLTNLTPERENR